MLNVLVVGSDPSHITNHLVPELAPAGVFMVDHWDWTNEIESGLPKGVEAIVMITPDLAEDRAQKVRDLAQANDVPLIETVRETSRIIEDIGASRLAVTVTEEQLLTDALEAHRALCGEGLTGKGVGVHVCERRSIGDQDLQNRVILFARFLRLLENRPETTNREMVERRGEVPKAVALNVAAKARVAMRWFWGLHWQSKTPEERQRIKEMKLSWAKRYTVRFLDEQGTPPTVAHVQDVARDVFGRGVSDEIARMGRRQALDASPKAALEALEAEDERVRWAVKFIKGLSDPSEATYRRVRDASKDAFDGAISEDDVRRAFSQLGIDPREAQAKRMRRYHEEAAEQTVKPLPKEEMFQKAWEIVLAEPEALDATLVRLVGQAAGISEAGARQLVGDARVYLRQHSMVRTDRLPPEEREQIRRSKVELARRAFRRGHRASGTFPTQQHVRLLGEPHYGRPLGWKLVAAVLREEKERHAAGDSPTGEEVAPESPPQLADVPPDARRVQVREPDGRVKFKRPSEVAPDDVIMRNAENDVVVMKGRPGRKPSKGADPKKPSTPSLEERVADLEHQLAVMRGRLGAKTQEVSRLEKRLKLAEMREVAEELDAAAEEAEREAEEEGQRAVDEVLSAIGEGDAETGDDATDVMDIINMVTDCEPDPTTQAKRDLFDNRTMLAEGVEGMRRLRHRVSTEGDGPTMAELRQLNDALLKSVEVLRDDRDRLQEELEARNGRGEITLSDLVRMGVGFTVTPGTQEPTDATP